MTSISVEDLLKLIGGQLKEDSPETQRFRELITQNKWSIEQYKAWLQECLRNRDQNRMYALAFQDIIVSLGGRLGFNIRYGKYRGKSEEIGYDGLWERPTGETVVLEVKSSTWPIGSVTQLGGYMDKFAVENNKTTYGLYIVGSGDVTPLVEQIRGSKFHDRMRVITYDKLLELLELEEQLKPALDTGAQKIQSLLLPLESINLGNIVDLISAISSIEEEEESKSSWSKDDLVAYLSNCTSYQKLLISAIGSAAQEPISKEEVIREMKRIAERTKLVDPSTITGYSIAGARGGLGIRRKQLNKEDIIVGGWDDTRRSYVYSLRSGYKPIVREWASKQGLV